MSRIDWGILWSKLAALLSEVSLMMRTMMRRFTIRNLKIQWAGFQCKFLWKKSISVFFCSKFNKSITPWLFRRIPVYKAFYCSVGLKELKKLIICSFVGYITNIQLNRTRKMFRRDNILAIVIGIRRFSTIGGGRIFRTRKIPGPNISIREIEFVMCGIKTDCIKKDIKKLNRKINRKDISGERGCIDW